MWRYVDGDEIILIFRYVALVACFMFNGDEIIVLDYLF